MRRNYYSPDVGSVSTCRECGRTLIAQRGWSTSHSIYFKHEEENSGCTVRALPREICCIVRADGQHCWRPIAPEQIYEGVYGCSYHLRQANVEKERKALEAERIERHQSMRELEQWEMKVYEEAELELRSLLGSDLFGESHAVRNVRRQSVLNRHASVDWVSLLEAVKKL